MVIVMEDYKGKQLYIYPSDYVLLDIETTGLNPNHAEIIEIGAYKVVNDEVVDTFETLIKPTEFIPEEITNINHITNEMVSDAPSQMEVLTKFDEFVGDSIIMGHNVVFDISFLTHYFYQYLRHYMLNDYVDTLTIARKVLKNTVPNHKLQTLSEYYGLDIEGEHRALKDVELTYKVYNKLKELEHERVNTI